MCDQVAPPIVRPRGRGSLPRLPSSCRKHAVCFFVTGACRSSALRLAQPKTIQQGARRTAMALSPRREFFAKLALLGGFAALGTARTKAQTMSSVTTADITCDNGMPAVLAYPAGGGSFPTVILMHERYGLVQHTRDQAMRCALDGYAVLAPNFFFRHPDQAALNAADSRS